MNIFKRSSNFDGYYIENQGQYDFLIWGRINGNGVVAKGYEITPPSLRTASDEILYEHHLGLSFLLAKLNPKEDTRLQIYWGIDGDYYKELERYHQETERLTEGKPQYAMCGIIRDKIYNRLKFKMEKGLLRREKLIFFLSRPLKNYLHFGFDLENKDDVKMLLDSVENTINTDLTMLQGSLKDCAVRPLTCKETNRIMYRRLNPSVEYSGIDVDALYKPEFSIMNNVLKEEINGKVEEKFQDRDNVCSFTMDGHYHKILSLSRFPDMSKKPMLFLQNVSDIKDRDFEIVVNIKAVDRHELIKKKEDSRARIGDNFERNPDKKSEKAAMEVLEKDILALSYGKISPLKVEYVIHVWDRDLKKLSAKVESIKAKVNSMGGADTIGYTLTSLSQHVFLTTLPGNLFYEEWEDALDAYHEPLAQILPYSATFTGFLAECMALYEGDNGNLTGVTLVVNGTTQHVIVLGQTGSGKSVRQIDFLLQAAPYFRKINIIEEGASYLYLSQALSGQFLNLSMDSEKRINYFDTMSLPLTPDKKNFVTRVLSNFHGDSGEKSIDNEDREASMGNVVDSIYKAKFKEWVNKGENAFKLDKIAREALTLKKLIDYLPVERQTILDAFAEFKDIMKIYEQNKRALNDTQEEIMKYYLGLDNIKDIIPYKSSYDPLLMELTFAYFGRNEFPVHSELVSMMQTSMDESHRKIAERLKNWSRDGNYGGFFDGYTNIETDSHLTVYEFGQIKDKKVKAVMATIVAENITNEINRLPRSDYKLVEFEEAASLMNVKHGDEIVLKFYTQARKMNAAVETITQSYDQFKKTGTYKTIFGQAKVFTLLRNTNRDELRELADYMPMTDYIIEQISTYREPEKIRGEKYSDYMLCATGEQGTVMGTIRNAATPETLLIAGTTGVEYTKREKEMKEIDARFGRTLTVPEKIMYMIQYKRTVDKATESIAELLETLKIHADKARTSGALETAQELKAIEHSLRVEISKAIKTNKLFINTKEEGGKLELEDYERQMQESMEEIIYVDE